MKPNIDRTGRVARAVSGTVCLLLGLSAGVLRWPEAPVLRWSIVVVLVVAGGFQLFEARKSWCAMRACGFRTPL